MAYILSLRTFWTMAGLWGSGGMVENGALNKHFIDCPIVVSNVIECEMEGIVNVAPPIITAIVTALIAWLVVRRKEQSEIRLIDTQTLNEWRDFERDTSEQLLKLNNALIEEQIKRRQDRDDMNARFEEMQSQCEKRIEMYKSQIAQMKSQYEAKIRSLEKRIRELENGKGQTNGH